MSAFFKLGDIRKPECAMKTQISKTGLSRFGDLFFSFLFFYLALGIITDHNSVLAMSRDV